MSASQYKLFARRQPTRNTIIQLHAVPRCANTTMEFSSLFQSVSKLEVLMGEMSACHAPAAENFVESFFSVHLRWIPVDTRSQSVDALVYGFY